MARQRKLKILLLGGGTGGHFYPLIAVAHELRTQMAASQLDADIRYFGDAGNYADELSHSGVKITHITTSKWRSYFSIQNFIDIFRFLWSIPQAFFKLFFFMPDVCFSKGGPGTLSMIYACKFYLIPIVIHESDAVPGRTNKIASTSAKCITLAFENAAHYFPKSRAEIVVTGNPVRSEIAAIRQLSPEDRASYRIEFSLHPELPVLLVMGGSQGADKINMFILEHLKELIGTFQIIHQVGDKNFASYKKEYEFLLRDLPTDVQGRYHFFPYLSVSQVAKAYAVANIVLSRAGAGAIFEAAATETPAIMVPLASSAQNHQFQNADIYHQTGAALILEEDNFLIGVFLDEARKIIQSPENITTMKTAARAFYREKSESVIANHILATALKQ